MLPKQKELRAGAAVALRMIDNINWHHMPLLMLLPCTSAPSRSCARASPALSFAQTSSDGASLPVSPRCGAEPEPAAKPAEDPGRGEEQKKPVALGVWIRALPMLIELLDKIWRRSLVVQPATARLMCLRAAC